MKKWLIAGSLVIVVLAVSGGFLLWKVVGDAFPETTTTEETPEARIASLRAGFHPEGDRSHGNAVTDRRIVADVERTLRALGHAYLNQDRKTINQLFSIQAFTSYVVDSGLVEDEGRFARTFLARAFRQTMAQDDIESGFSQLELGGVERISENEVIAFVEVYNDRYDSLDKMRWWLIQDNDGDWAAYDYEYVSKCYRASHFVGSTSRAQTEGAAWLEPLDRYLKIATGTNYQKICRESRALLRHDLPRSVELEVLLMVYPLALYIEGHLEEAIKVLERAATLTGGDPSVLLDRGWYRSTAGNHKLAIWDVDIYVDAFGWDTKAREVAMTSHSWLGNGTEAVPLAEDLLAENPQDVTSLGVLACFHPEERRADVVNFLSGLDEKEAGYEAILVGAYNYEQEAALDVYGPMLRKDFPTSKLIADYLID